MVSMIPNLDVDHLKTFLAIAETGNFTKAADEMNKTQSAVSMQMKRLDAKVAAVNCRKMVHGLLITRGAWWI
jgi:Bacterial regulatory helix-turn-helix protein, lysR family